MKISFPYDIQQSSIFDQVRRPTAIVSIWSKKYKRFIKYSMIVDTGADYTLLPFSKAGDLGVDLEKDCRKYSSFGIGGSEAVYFLKKKIKIKIGEKTEKIPVGFLTRDDIPPLLGREDCLNKFSLLFVNLQTTFTI